jgi:hypothetical protein
MTQKIYNYEIRCIVWGEKNENVQDVFKKCNTHTS